MFPLAAGAVIYQGALVALDASGDLVAGATALNLVAVGHALENVDNTGGLAGALSCAVSCETARWENDGGGTPVAATNIGSDCYILDDETVSGDSTGRSVAGQVYQVDSDGVWVIPAAGGV